MTRNREKILRAASAFLALVLVGCTGGQTSSQKQSTPNDCYLEIKNAMQDSDHFEVYFDEAENKIAIISTTEYLDTYLALLQLGDNFEKEWQDTVDAMMHLASSAQKICVEHGCESTVVTLDVVSNRDRSVSYLTIVNGKITYDAYAKDSASSAFASISDVVDLREFMNVCESSSISARSVGGLIEVCVYSYFSPDVRPTNWTDICARLTDALDAAIMDTTGPAVSAQILAKDQTILATAFRGAIAYDHYLTAVNESDAEV